jgi:hypothetical protein
MKHVGMIEKTPETHQQSVALPKYEIHITVRPDNGWFLDEDRDKFKNVCEYLQVKPLYIENIDRGLQTKYFDILTSSVMECHRYPTAYRMMIDIAFELELAGYKIIRRKIECHPKNPRVEFGKGQYFEAHIKTDDIDAILQSGLPLSINRKTRFNPDAVDTKILTYRRKNLPYESFQLSLEDRLKGLRYDMGAGGVETEYCLFDDNENLDQPWLDSYAAG